MNASFSALTANTRHQYLIPTKPIGGNQLLVKTVGNNEGIV
jgi:hypothetical protein